MFDRNLMRLAGMRATLGALVVLALLQAAGIAGQAWALSGAIAALWGGADFASQAPLVGAFAACFALVQLARFAQDTMLDARARAVAGDLRGLLLERALDARSGTVARAGSAHVTTAATEGADQVESYVRVIPPKMAGVAAVSVPLLAFCFYVDAVSGVLLAVMFPVIIFFMVLLGRRAQARAERQYESYTRLSNRFMDTLRGIDAIEALGAGDAESRAVWSFSEKLRAATIRTLSTATLSSAVLDLCATFGVAAVAIMLAFRLMDGSLALGPALCALMLAPEYFLPIRAFASDFHASLDGKNALADILAMIEGDGEAAQAGANGTARVDKEKLAAEREGESDGDHFAVKDVGGVCNEQANCPNCFEIEFDDVAFAYDGAAAQAAIDVNLALRPGEHVALVGASGSGKSTLAALAAGLLAPDAGSVRVRDAEAVRFVPQHPHIFAASLLDNVRFYAPSATREQALAACSALGLDELLAELPDGLDTQVGQGGRGLSGGQAHRVALARLLLDERARVLVFDEPTAHLDVETERELKERILPLLEGKTVLFATHRLHWTDSMDRVVTLEGGRIAKVEPGGRIAAKAAPIPRWNNGNGGCCPSDLLGQQPPSPLSHPEPIDSSARKWIGSVLERHRRHVAVALALGALAGGFSALLMFASGYLISATATPGVTLFSILLPVAFVQVFGLGRPIARYLERLVSHDWVFRVTSELRRRLFDAMRSRSGDPARARSAAEYLAVLDDDVAHVQNLYLRAFFPMTTAWAVAVGAVALFAVFSFPAAACATLVLAAACAGLPWSAYRATRRLSVWLKGMKTAAYEAVADDVDGALDWTLSRRAPEAIASHARADALLRDGGGRLRLRVRAFELTCRLMAGASCCAVLAWSAATLHGPDANWIAAFALGVFPLFEQFGGLPSAAAASAEHLAAARRIAEFTADDEEQAELPEDGDGSAVDGNPTAALEFESLRYAYPAAGRFALDGFTLEIPAGQTVAVIGRSGAGKSTLAQLARGRMRPSGGTVRACGLDPWENRARMHRHVGALSQDPHVFDRSLRDNLRLGAPSASDDELVQVLESAGLGPALRRLPQGLGTMVGETGMGFSGGEAHRVALARVLAAGAPVLVVDEPFSALDPQTEAALMETLLAAAQGRTLVVITHHLAHVQRFDRVVFVEDGAVALDGSPDELERESAYFRSLLEFDR